MYRFHGQFWYGSALFAPYKQTSSLNFLLRLQIYTLFPLSGTPYFTFHTHFAPLSNSTFICTPPNFLLSTFIFLILFSFYIYSATSSPNLNFPLSCSPFAFHTHFNPPFIFHSFCPLFFISHPVAFHIYLATSFININPSTKFPLLDSPFCFPYLSLPPFTVLTHFASNFNSTFASHFDFHTHFDPFGFPDSFIL